MCLLLFIFTVNLGMWPLKWLSWKIELCSEGFNTYLWGFQEDRWENVHYESKPRHVTLTFIISENQALFWGFQCTFMGFPRSIGGKIKPKMSSNLADEPSLANVLSPIWNCHVQQITDWLTNVCSESPFETVRWWIPPHPKLKLPVTADNWLADECMYWEPMQHSQMIHIGTDI